MMRRIRLGVCSQTHRPDGQLGNRQVSQPLVVDHNKIVENNNPELRRHSENIADTEVGVLELDCTGNAQVIEH